MERVELEIVQNVSMKIAIKDTPFHLNFGKDAEFSEVLFHSQLQTIVSVVHQMAVGSMVGLLKQHGQES